MNKLFQQKQSLALYNFKGIYNERIIRDCRECRSSLSVCRFGRCGNRRGIVYRLWRCQRLVPAVRSCLCRCTPAIDGYHPRRSGCISGRQSAGPLRIQRQRRPDPRHRPRRQRQTQLRL